MNRRIFINNSLLLLSGYGLSTIVNIVVTKRTAINRKDQIAQEYLNGEIDILDNIILSKTEIKSLKQNNILPSVVYFDLQK